MVLAVVVPAASLIAWYVLHEWREARTAAYAQVRILAEDTATNIHYLLHDNEVVLRRLADRPLVKALDPRRCDPILAEYVAVRPEFSTLAVRNARAEIVCTLLADPPAAQQVRNAPWFVEAMRSGKFTVSDATQRPDPASWVSISAYPIRGRGEGVEGFVFFSVDLMRLGENLFKSVPKSAVVEVLDGHARFLLRSSDAGRWIGRSPPEPVAWGPDRQDYFLQMGADNIKRLYAVVPVAGTQWHVFAGLPEDEVLAASRQRLARGTLVGLATLLLVLMLSYRVSSAIVNPIRRLARTSARVAAGDSTARAELAGPPEVKAVARQFNEMLDVRDHNEALLREAESVLITKNRALAEAVEKLEAAGQRTMRAEKAALDYARRLRALGRRLVDLQECEQRGLARELHDSVSSSLAVVGLELHAIEEELSAESLDTVGPRLADCIELVKGIMENARDISSDLHCAVLEHAGLAAALEDLGAKFERRTGLRVEVDAPRERRRLPGEIETALFRIAQEALTNCAKHAFASHARLELKLAEDEAALKVSDDGRGFDAEPLRGSDPQPGLGLLSMRERAEAIGGEFHLSSAPGKGTLITVRAPLAFGGEPGRSAKPAGAEQSV